MQKALGSLFGTVRLEEARSISQMVEWADGY
jgi:hypothetical protein